MKIALIGTSSYQIIGLLNAISSLYDCDNCEVDFYLIGSFFNSDSIFNILKESKLFKKVYLLKRGNSRSIGHLIDLVREFLLSAKSNLKILTHDFGSSFIYDCIICENYFPVAIFLRIVNPSAKFYIIEDGTAQYYFPMELYIYGEYKKRKKIYNFFKKKFVDYKVDSILCYDPDYVHEVQGEFCNYQLIKSVDFVSNKFLSGFFKMFALSSIPLYKNHRFIILDTHGIGAGIEQFEEAFLPYLDNILVRPHPRDISREYPFPCIDRFLDPWELVCVEGITNNHVLIGNYSTAQFCPKLLYKKEPWVLFTLCLDESTKKSEYFDEMKHHIVHFKKTYSNPEKVVIIEDSAHLRRVLNEISDGNSLL